MGFGSLFGFLERFLDFPDCLVPTFWSKLDAAAKSRERRRGGWLSGGGLKGYRPCGMDIRGYGGGGGDEIFRML